MIKLNLTDKIIEAGDTNPTAKVLFVSDVKEHIEILKEKLKKARENDYPIVALDNTFEIINEVFGDKFI